ncbi:MAG: tRNA glutamyl-Q(34) synthetase GluQRS [Burkholderiaceae bacterium]
MAARRAPAYVGRFAPSPTGPLHAGSLVAALASRLDALAHGGRWLLRIEDLDPPREMPGATAAIIDALQRLGFAHDGEIEFQSRRGDLYQQAFDRLLQAGWVYPCACTRREIADSIVSAAGLGTSTAAVSAGAISTAAASAATVSGAPPRHADRVYPGTCRAGMPAGRPARAWRVRVDDAVIDWHDRRGGWRREALARTVGDFVLRRADGLWAYQLAVVVDDADQAVSDVVRGADLRDSTARQIHLQRLLGVPTPRYLHVPVVTDVNGEKLSKQTGAAALDVTQPLEELNRALNFLGLGSVAADSLDAFWSEATRRWAATLAQEGV